MSSRVAWAVSGLLCISACTRPQAAVDSAQASTVATTSTLQSLFVLVPKASEFTSAPLHNRVRVQLKASGVDVWSLVGDLGRLPEYSSGLEKVEPIWGADKKLAEYVCHFKPAAPGGARRSAARRRWTRPSTTRRASLRPTRSSRAWW